MIVLSQSAQMNEVLGSCIQTAHMSEVLGSFYHILGNQSQALQHLAPTFNRYSEFEEPTVPEQSLTSSTWPASDIAALQLDFQVVRRFSRSVRQQTFPTPMSLKQSWGFCSYRTKVQRA